MLCKVGEMQKVSKVFKSDFDYYQRVAHQKLSQKNPLTYRHFSKKEKTKLFSSSSTLMIVSLFPNLCFILIAFVYNLLANIVLKIESLCFESINKFS